MTDGIIQEVFKEISINYAKYINEHHCSGILMRTQTELIEKIKQTSFSNQWLFDNETKKKLIGDNQE